jgi:TonB family protein
MDGGTPSSSIPFDDLGRGALRVSRGDTQVRYPPEVLDRFGVGVVVVHFGVDASGAATSRTIGAAIPPGALGDAVAAVMEDWRTEKDPSAAPSCRMPPSFFYPVRFVLTER